MGVVREIFGLMVVVIPFVVCAVWSVLTHSSSRSSGKIWLRGTNGKNAYNLLMEFSTSSSEQHQITKHKQYSNSDPEYQDVQVNGSRVNFSDVIFKNIYTRMWDDCDC